MFLQPLYTFTYKKRHCSVQIRKLTSLYMQCCWFFQESPAITWSSRLGTVLCQAYSCAWCTEEEVREEGGLGILHVVYYDFDNMCNNLVCFRTFLLKWCLSRATFSREWHVSMHFTFYLSKLLRLFVYAKFWGQHMLIYFLLNVTTHVFFVEN